ncbi:PDR/VanB family oxidoreductase [Streptomyces sp. NBC_01619]|uniref:PDR/VanB family oxidoreductase n=1 Tax=Streptomyces pratisoli TaxID=3139917 RepID=A0ACC6QEH6_9ACTN|nr:MULTISPECIES: PDR/VanB family oxidoreductase [unclassified Streptomyces]MCX4509468.1 PDR/VanB family oxidoreductase [Streptomyces sp. NBC_01619]
MPRLRTVALVAGTALLARRALRRRIAASPLWPMPALEEPVSGRGGRRASSHRVLVTERTTPAEGVVQLRLEGAHLPRWEPGAHIDLVLPSGRVRQYSLCGDPEDSGTYTIATRLVEDGHGGSREVHEHLHDGTEVEIRGPRNRFPLAGSASYLFLAGGIGITPVLPMVRALHAAGATNWRLLYCGRDRATMPYVDEAEELGATTVSGRPDLGFLAGLPAETVVYCCGPQGLMDAVAAALPEGRELRLERFTAAAAAPGGAFELELRRSGRTLTVPAGRSVLDAVRDELPDVSYSCRQGFCGTCQQRVLEGGIDHRDELLTDAERSDSMLICVSRCTSGRLVLDL